MAKQNPKEKYAKRGESTKASNKQEIKKLNEKLSSGDLAPDKKANIEERVKFLGGTPVSAPSVTPPPPPAPTPTETSPNAPPSPAAVADPTGINRTKDVFSQGTDLYNQYIAPELQGQFLGRIGDTALDPVLQDVLNKRVAGLEGYSAEENNALREAGTQGLNQEFQTQLRALQGVLGKSNVLGGAAGQRFVPLVGARNQAQQGLERDLFIENVAEKQRRLQGLQELAQNQQKTELGKQEYNLGQQASELAARLGGKFNTIGTVGGLSSGIRAEDLAAQGLKSEEDRQKENLNFVGQQNQLLLDAFNKVHGRSLNI